MATRGLSSVCFACGQPLPPDLPAEVDVPAAGPVFPLTGAMESPLAPPPNPYAAAREGATAASIIGQAGQFAIRAGVEVRVGRDPAQCPIALTEPRVSGVHATLKFEGGQVMVRDEGSNNGTYVNGARIAQGVFTAVPVGGALRFGPVEFTVRVE